jgi:hypothetical protein
MSYSASPEQEKQKISAEIKMLREQIQKLKQKRASGQS